MTWPATVDVVGAYLVDLSDDVAPEFFCRDCGSSALEPECILHEPACETDATPLERFLAAEEVAR